MGLFDLITIAPSPEPVPQRTSIYLRAIVRVRRVEEGRGSFAFETSISPRTADWGMRDWIGESADEIVHQLRRAKRLKVGQAATFDVLLKPWSHTYHSYDTGPEYDCGFDVKRSRTLRCSKRFRA